MIITMALASVLPTSPLLPAEDSNGFIVHLHLLPRSLLLLPRLGCHPIARPLRGSPFVPPRFSVRHTLPLGVVWDLIWILAVGLALAVQQDPVRPFHECVSPLGLLFRRHQVPEYNCFTL